MWDFLLPMVEPVITKIFALIPDPNARAKAREEFERELLSAVNQANLAQTKVDEIEAAHASVFVAGWRPFIGWVCGFGLAWAFLIQPILVWTITCFDLAFKAPIINSDPLYQLVLAMLGMGGMRTFEKIKAFHAKQGMVQNR